MRLQILLATVTLISTLCSACSGSRNCLNSPLANIAVSYSMAGQNEQALQVAQRITTLTRKADVLSLMALQAAKAGQKKESANLFNQALQAANKIEPSPDKVMALEAIAARYGRVGQKDKAAEVLAQAVQDTKAIWGTSFVKDTVLEKIAINYAQLGDYTQGIKVANKIVEDIPKSRALARIVAYYVAAGEYNQARQIANTIEVHTSKANALIEIAEKTGEYQQALTVAQNIDEEERALWKSLILGKITLLYSKSGQNKQADEILSQAIKAAKNIEETDAQLNQLARIALLYIETGKQEQAIKLASQTLQVVNQIQDVYKKAVLLANIAVVYGKAGKKELADSVFAQAIQVARTLNNEDKKTQTLAELAINSARVNPYHQVLQLTQTIGNAKTQAYALSRIARDYEKAGNKEQATQALEQAFQIAQTIENTPDKSQKLAEIAVQLGRIAQYDRAIAIAQTLDATETDSPKASALAHIANYYAKVGQKEKAIALLSQALQAVKVTQCSD